MPDPYDLLGLPPGADEAAIRRRYLQLVREHPPDRSPRRFAEIRQAYEQLRDPVHRLETELFEVRTNDSLDQIIADLRARLRMARIPTRILLSLADK